MVLIPGGEFRMGADGGFPFEGPSHPVTVESFYLDATEVTNRDFSAFVEATGYVTESEREGSSGVFDTTAGDWTLVKGAGWKHPTGPDSNIEGKEDHPVIHVSWNDANAFAHWAGKRLPTEAEWEYAAAWNPRAGEKRHYPWGSQLPDAAHARLECAGVAPVEAYPAGDAASGCRQMIGNVWEWTASTFGPYPGFVVDPYQEYSEPWFGTHKVLRGGSFATTRRLIRNTWRNFYTPERYDVFAGFRTCALEK